MPTVMSLRCQLAIRRSLVIHWALEIGHWTLLGHWSLVIQIWPHSCFTIRHVVIIVRRKKAVPILRGRRAGCIGGFRIDSGVRTGAGATRGGRPGISTRRGAPLLPEPVVGFCCYRCSRRRPVKAIRFGRGGVLGLYAGSGCPVFGYGYSQCIFRKNGGHPARHAAGLCSHARLRLSSREAQFNMIVAFHPTLCCDPKSSGGTTDRTG